MLRKSYASLESDGRRWRVAIIFLSLQRNRTFEIVQMNDVRIPLNEFIESYRESIGLDPARQLIKQTLSKVGLPNQDDYTKAEALRICRELKQSPGFIGIIANILSSRFTIR